MKQIESINVRGSDGLRPVATFFRWTYTVEGMDFEFALTEDPRAVTGQQRTMSIVEVKTGFNVAARVHHPKSRNKMSLQSMAGLKRQDVIKAARAALHNKIHEVGSVAFIHAMAQAQLIAAKQDLDAKNFGVDFQLQGV